VVVYHAAVVQKVVKNLAYIGGGLWTQSINCNVCGLEVGLACGPWLVIPQARLASYRVVLDERKPVKLGAVKRRSADRPGEGLQSLNGKMIGKMLEDEGRGREKSEASVRGRGCH
jgi:hypothetical protein